MAILGNDWKLYLGKEDQSGTTWTPIYAELNSSLNLTCDAIETTTKEDWKTYIGGMKGGTASITMYVALESAGTLQEGVLRSLMAGERIKCFFGKIDVAKDTQTGYQFYAIVTSISETAEKGGLLSRDASLQITGEVTPMGLLKNN